MTDLTDRQINVLLDVRDRRTYQEIIEHLGVRSFKTAQDIVAELVEMGFVEILKNEEGNTKIKGRAVTPKGRKWLKEHDYHID